MKKTLIIISLVILSFPVLTYSQDSSDASSTGIQFFEGSWEEALQKAKDEDKAIFLDVFASWCGPCKLLKNETFPDAKTGKYFNENFINVSLDGEKGEGISLARELGVRAYPSLFIVNANGQAVLYYAGYLGANDLVEFGKAGIQKTIAEN